jgi:hypothetical protein
MSTVFYGQVMVDFGLIVPCILLHKMSARKAYPNLEL